MLLLETVFAVEIKSSVLVLRLMILQHSFFSYLFESCTDYFLKACPKDFLMVLRKGFCENDYENF